MRVLDRLKPHAMLPPNDAILTITRLGGEHLEGKTLVRSGVQGFVPLRQDVDYLLCLSWNVRRHEFDVHFGPDGVHELTAAGAVQPLGHQPVAEQQHGKLVEAFLREVAEATAR